MEEEIDLRQYIQVLIYHWKWIVGITVAIALIALAASFAIPLTYEATALVAVTQPRYVMQFDPRFETVNNIQPAYKVYPELATSDVLLQALYEQLLPFPNGMESIAGLSHRLEAKAGADPSLIRLTASSQNKEEAARIANAWAELFVKQANQVYGTSNTEQLRTFQIQLQQARTELEASQQALANFQANNQVTILKNQLNSYSATQTDYLIVQQNITFTIQSIHVLRNQLAEQPGENPVSLADQLTVLLLQLKAFNTQADNPVQLQISDAASFSGKSIDEQIALLDDLANSLQFLSTDIDTRLAEIRTRILATQKQLQEALAAEEQMTRDRDVAQETYMTLARKTEEVRISAQSTTGDVVKLASQASIPEKPASPRKAVNTAIAGMLGLILSVVGVFAIEWWREETEPIAKQETEDA